MTTATRKRLMAVVLAAGLTFGATACGGDESSPTESDAPSQVGS